MSNATEHSHSSGNNNNRRRRSRGGKNRNGQQNRHDNRNDNRHGGDHRHSSGSQRSEEFRPQGPRPPRHAPLPPKLSFFQKILKAVGLYKVPAAPARPPQKPAQAQPQAKSGQGEARPPKSNTRNARSDGGGKPASERQPQGQQPSGKRERAPRGDKPRGGDGSTVESPRVYVGNLSYDVTEQDLQELFKGIGPVRSVEIVYNRSTHRSKGYGFVEMLHKDEAVRTVEVLHDQPFMGRKLIVSGAKSKGQDEREDQEEIRPQAKVTLAPLPPAETVQAIAEPPAPAALAEAPAVAETAEPVIETIVETVAAEAPAAESAESAEPETKPEIA